MPNDPKLIVFKGATSQTGLAATLELPGIPFVGEKEEFDDIKDLLRATECLAILPTWNSHEGQITKAWVLDLLFNRTARIYRLWPKPIQFQCVSRTESKPDQLKRIISIGVAEKQCSKFLETTGCPKLVGANSTLDGYRAFHNDATLDAVLCAPGQNEENYPIVSENAENRLNFTTFALLGCNASKGWDNAAWGKLVDRIQPANCWFRGVVMPRVEIGRDEAVNLVLQEITRDAQGLVDVPKILFVCERSSDTVGLMLESQDSEFIVDTLTSEGESGDVAFVGDMGESSILYTQRVLKMLQATWQVPMDDFLRHRGVDSCFYACPALDIVTHGFDQSLVEPVVRRVIGKYFDLYLNENVQCTPAQRDLFERHKDAYLEAGGDAFGFSDIGY